jgi:hypothetical protein
MKELKEILKVIDSAPGDFEARIPAVEKSIFRGVSLLLKDLKVSENGKIEAGIENLKLISAIKAKLGKIVVSKQYADIVNKFVSNIPSISNLQTSTAGVPAASKKMMSAVAKIRIDNTLESLIGAGYKQEVVSKLYDTLLTNVTSGGSYADMIEQLQNQLVTTEKKPGMLSKYAKTYVVDALGQFAGQGNKMIADALKSEWFQYVGSNLTSTREFCEHMTKKRYVHISEFPAILAGEIDGHQCKIYEATGLPYGMKEGTDKDNFIENRGGWNCGHQLYPVSEAAVPLAVREKIKASQPKTQAQIDEKLTSNTKLDEVIQIMDNAKISYNEVNTHQKPLVESEIIQRVGGGDMTRGSCSSLAFAYVGNKCGFDVLDFRDGVSRQTFSSPSTIMDIAEKAGGVVSKHTNDFTKATELLKTTQEGKEYYFSCGSHAAIVRKTATGYEYLELQSATKNGFKPLTKVELKHRFGAKQSHTSYGRKYETRDCIMDIELLKKDDSFRKLLGYINTSESKQKKGEKGSIK